MPATYTDRRAGLSTSLAVKAPCRVATTAAITLSGLQTIDGVTVVEHDRVLVKDQADPVYNGIWDASPRTWTRALDFDGTLDAIDGTRVAVRQGTTYTTSYFAVVATDPIYIGVTAIAFTLVSEQPGPKGDPGGNVSALSARADIPGLTVSTSTKRIGTDGAVTSGDLGHADYILDSEQTAITAQGTVMKLAAIGRGQSSGSALAAVTLMETRFRPADSTGKFFRLGSVRSHLAYALSGDTALLTMQAMIDATTYWKQPMGYIAGGDYTLGGPLWVTRGDTFRQVQLRGAGRRYSGATDISDGTVLRFTDATVPALILQGYRSSSITGMTLLGAALTTLIARNMGNSAPVDGSGNPVDDYDITTWQVGGLAEKRYAPHAAIALDPFVGTQPPGSGAAAPYSLAAGYNPDWLGPLALYGRNTSSVCNLDVEIQGFEVGIVVNPSQSTNQTDYTTLSNVQISYCPYALSIGDQQSRSVNLYGFSGALCHTFVTNRRHGAQAGRISGTMQISVGAGIRLLDLDLAQVGTVTIQDGYAELLLYLGDVTSGTAAGIGTLVFLNGEYNLTAHPAQRGSPPYALGAPTNPGGGVDYTLIKVIGGNYAVENILPMLVNLLDFDAQILVVNAVNGYWESASGNAAAISDNTERRRRKMAHNGALGLSTPRMASSAAHRINGVAIDVDNAASAYQPVYTNARTYAFSQRKYGIPHWQRTAMPWGYAFEAPAELVTMPRRAEGLPKSACTGATQTNRRWAFTLPSYFMTTFEYSARTYNIAPGRVCIDTVSGTSFWIVSINYTTGAVVMEALHNYYRPVGAGADVHRSAFSFGDGGTLFFIETAFFMPAQTLVGDVTSGSAVVTNLRDPTGGFAWLTNGTYAAQHPAAGDWLYYDRFNPGLYPFTLAAAKMSALDTGARTMTMAGNSALTLVGQTFPLFRRGD